MSRPSRLSTTRTAPTALLDRGSRVMWRALGRPVDLDGEHAWLTAPMHSGSRVADGWVADAAAALGGRTESDGEGGLLADLAALDGPGFSAGSIDPMIRRFYEQTSGWRMEVWAQWNPLLQPGGEFISRVFGTRVQQLAIPTRPLDVAHGMDSTVVRILDGDGNQHAAAWLRTLRDNGDYVYSGCYSVRSLPGSDRPSVHVAFPLESGNVQVSYARGQCPTVASNSALPQANSARMVRMSWCVSAARMRPEHPSTRRSGCMSTTSRCCAPTTSCGWDG